MLCILSAMAAEAEVRPSQLLPCVLRPPFYPFLPWPIPRRAQPLLPLVASSALLQQLSLPLQRSPVYPHKLRKSSRHCSARCFCILFSSNFCVSNICYSLLFFGAGILVFFIVVPPFYITAFFTTVALVTTHHYINSVRLPLMMTPVALILLKLLARWAEHM